MKKKNTTLTRQPLYDIIAVVLAIFGAYMVQIVYGGQYESANQKNAQLTQEIALKSVLVETDDVAGTLSQMQEYIPADSQRSLLTGTISQWAGDIGIDLVGIDFVEAPRGQSDEDSSMSSLEFFQVTPKQETLRIQIRGGEQAILEFLQQLEDSPRLIDITTVSYSDGNTGLDLVGSIEAYTYYQ